MELVQQSLFENLEQDRPEKAARLTNCLSQMLRELMKEFNLTQHEVSIAAEIPESTLSEWLNGKVKLQQSDSRLHRLARVFNTTVDHLLFGTHEDPTAGIVIDYIRHGQLERFSKEITMKFSDRFTNKQYTQAIKLGLVKNNFNEEEL